MAGDDTFEQCVQAFVDRDYAACAQQTLNFYRRILAGEGRADALRNAQLALRQKYPDPYFWGAFICQGDPAPLRGPAQRIVGKTT